MSGAPLAMLTRRFGTIIAVRSDRCAACDLVDLCGPEYACPPFRAAGCYRGITQLRAGKGGVMKACLTRIEARIYWIDDEGQEREGAPGRVSGDLSRVSGNLNGVSGNLRGVYGNLSGVSGDLSRVSGDLSRVSGDLRGVSGDLSRVYGDLSGVYGDLSRVSGNLSGVSGDLSRVYGDIDDAGITDDEREAGISIVDLIRDDAAEAAKE